MITFTEWGEEVLTILPELTKVAEAYGLFLNQEAAERLIEEGEYLTVFTMLRGVCDGLQIVPSAAIHYVSLCSICHRYPHEDSH